MEPVITFLSTSLKGCGAAANICLCTFLSLPANHENCSLNSWQSVSEFSNYRNWLGVFSAFICLFKRHWISLWPPALQGEAGVCVFVSVVNMHKMCILCPAPPGSGRLLLWDGPFILCNPMTGENDEASGDELVGLLRQKAEDWER